jgi:hypothetical protein
MERNRIGNISFSTENIEEFIKKCTTQKELLPLYLDRIRNCYLLNEEMLKNIEQFDNTSKMKIIYEYNRCIMIFKSALDDYN